MWAKRIEKIFMQLLGVILSIAFLFPIYVLAINSFKPLRDIYKNAINFPETWSVENYIKAFDRLNFFNSFTNSLKITCSFLYLFFRFTLFLHLQPGHW